MPLPSQGDLLLTRTINERFNALEQKLAALSSLDWKLESIMNDIAEIKTALTQANKNQSPPANRGLGIPDP